MKIFNNLLTATTMLFLIYSCGGHDDKFKNNLYYSNTYESVKGWCDNSLIVKCNAHSGKYACRIDKNNIYSMGFASPLKEITLIPIRRVEISVWVKVENIAASAKVVVEVANSKDSIIFWKSSETKDFVTEIGEWNQVYLKCDFPLNLNPEGTIKIYLLNQSDEAMLTDDLEIVFNESTR